MKKVYIGSDYIGFPLKQAVIDYIRTSVKDVEVVDCGCASGDDTTAYPIHAQNVCDKVTQDEGSRGILICGTGIGMCITANKIKGIYAAVCHDEYACERSILSNNANVLCLGQRIVSEFEAKRIVGTWLSLEFKESPSSQKIAIVYDIESKNMK